MNLVIVELKLFVKCNSAVRPFAGGIRFCTAVYTTEQNPVTAKNKRYGLGQLSLEIWRRCGKFYNELMINSVFRTTEINVIAYKSKW